MISPKGSRGIWISAREMSLFHMSSSSPLGNHHPYQRTDPRRDDPYQTETPIAARPIKTANKINRPLRIVRLMAGAITRSRAAWVSASLNRVGREGAGAGTACAPREIFSTVEGKARASGALCRCRLGPHHSLKCRIRRDRGAARDSTALAAAMTGCHCSLIDDAIKRFLGPAQAQR